MERAVGEVFDFNGAKLRVDDILDNSFCYGCYFYESGCPCDIDDHASYIGACLSVSRADGKNVIFVKVDNLLFPYLE